MLLTIDEVRHHLRLDPQSTDTIEEDSELELMYYSAVEYVSKFVNYDITSETDVPNTFKSAILLLIADLYENREAQGDRQLHNNTMVNQMLHFHRRELGV